MEKINEKTNKVSLFEIVRNNDFVAYSVTILGMLTMVVIYLW